MTEIYHSCIFFILLEFQKRYFITFKDVTFISHNCLCLGRMDFIGT